MPYCWIWTTLGIIYIVIQQKKIYIVGDPPFIKGWSLSFEGGFEFPKFFPKIGVSDLSHIKRGLIYYERCSKKEVSLIITLITPF